MLTKIKVQLTGSRRKDTGWPENADSVQTFSPACFIAWHASLHQHLLIHKKYFSLLGISLSSSGCSHIFRSFFSNVEQNLRLAQT